MSGIINSAGSKSGVIGTTEMVYEEIGPYSSASVGALTGTMGWRAVKIGNIVTVIIDHQYGTTSNVAYIQPKPDIPVGWRPFTYIDFPVVCAIKNNVRVAGGTLFVIEGDGEMKFTGGLYSSSTWGTAATTGLEARTSFTWYATV